MDIQTLTEFNKASYDRREEINVHYLLQFLFIRVHNADIFIYDFQS